MLIAKKSIAKIESLLTVPLNFLSGKLSFPTLFRRMILPNDSIDFRTNEKTDECPMAMELFEYDFVKGVFIMNKKEIIAFAKDFKESETFKHCKISIVLNNKILNQEDLVQIEDNIEGFYIFIQRK